jgi:hypothetical protein
MIYSGNHSLALARVYSEMFGQDVPQDVARAAASNGAYQQLMAAIDQATDTGQPIEDWVQFQGGDTYGSRSGLRNTPN